MSESFAQLLEESFASQKIKPGSILTGTVVGVNQDVVIVNAGLKSEAVISADQFFNERGELEVKVGDVVEVALDTVEDGFGETRASLYAQIDRVLQRAASVQADKAKGQVSLFEMMDAAATGDADNFPDTDPSDVLIDLVYAVKAGYRQNGMFVMNRKTQAAVRKFKDEGGNYLWQPPAANGTRATLMTFPVIEAEDMPDIAANSYSIAFGDFRRGYLVVDRAGVTVLRDPFSAKPYVLFYTTKRVGGGVQDFDAIKLLKFAAS